MSLVRLSEVEKIGSLPLILNLENCFLNGLLLLLLSVLAGGSAVDEAFGVGGRDLFFALNKPPMLMRDAGRSSSGGPDS